MQQTSHLLSYLRGPSQKSDYGPCFIPNEESSQWFRTKLTIGRIQVKKVQDPYTRFTCICDGIDVNIHMRLCSNVPRANPYLLVISSLFLS